MDQPGGQDQQQDYDDNNGESPMRGADDMGQFDGEMEAQEDGEGASPDQQDNDPEQQMDDEESPERENW